MNISVLDKFKSYQSFGHNRIPSFIQEHKNDGNRFPLVNILPPPPLNLPIQKQISNHSKSVPTTTYIPISHTKLGNSQVSPSIHTPQSHTLQSLPTKVPLHDTQVFRPKDLTNILETVALLETKINTSEQLITRQQEELDSSKSLLVQLKTQIKAIHSINTVNSGKPTLNLNSSCSIISNITVNSHSNNQIFNQFSNGQISNIQNIDSQNSKIHSSNNQIINPKIPNLKRNMSSADTSMHQLADYLKNSQNSVNSSLISNESEPRNGSLASSPDDVAVETVKRAKMNEEVGDDIPCEAASCERFAKHECSSCKNAFYCSMDCQISDWNNGHQSTCNIDL